MGPAVVRAVTDAAGSVPATLQVAATPTEVVERVKAVLRRAAPARSTERPIRRFGRLEVDLAAHDAIVDGRPVRFTAKEFAILELFIEHQRQVFSRDHLFELIWGDFGDRSAVGVYIRKLREKIETDPRHPELIVTVWGVGYRFDPPRAT